MVELSSAKRIDALLRDGKSPRPRSVQSVGLTPFEQPYAGKPRRRCRCGQCAICIDNAKWERVFQQKFADPDYYKPRFARQGSSLG